MGYCGFCARAAQWRELPKKYPAYQTCDRRFQQRERIGQLDKALRALTREPDGHGLLPAWSASAA